LNRSTSTAQGSLVSIVDDPAARAESGHSSSGAVFVKKYVREMNRRAETIPAQTMEQLSRCQWPGNIHELQNVIARAVILLPGKVLHSPLNELGQCGRRAMNGHTSTRPQPITLQDCERQHILKTLDETRSLVGGPQGAAAVLGRKRTTLISTMEKPGITRKAKPTSERINAVGIPSLAP
jgi:formate hydrogenlyase transcriptional activator